MLYVENENGECVDGHRASDIRKVARAIWVRLADAGKAPKSWMKADLATADEYNREMLQRYPELRLCEANWKAAHIAIENYPSWHTNYFKNSSVEQQGLEIVIDPLSNTTPRTRGAKRHPLRNVEHSVKRKKVGSLEELPNQVL